MSAHEFKTTPPIMYRITTDTGDAILQFPSVLSVEDCAILQAWLDRMKEKVARGVRTAPAQPEGTK